MIKVTIIALLILFSILDSIDSQQSVIMPEPSSSLEISLFSVPAVTTSSLSSMAPEITATQTTNNITTTTTISSSSLSTFSSPPSQSSFSTPATTSTTSSNSSIPTAVETNGANDDGNDKKNQFLTEIKYIYIIVGIILFLILIIIVLIAVVSIMCQRRMFDRKQKRKRTSKNASRAQLIPTSVEVHRSLSSPLRTPKSPKRTNPIECGQKNGGQKTSNTSPMSDFPLLCRVLQDYDSTQHKVRQTSVSSSNDVFSSPVRKNETLANGTANTTITNGAISAGVAASETSHPVNQNKPKPLTINDELKSLMQNNETFPRPSNSKMHSPIKPLIPNKKTDRVSSDSSSDRDFETSWGKSTTVSNVSGYHDSHDYDELESMIEHLKKRQGSPPKSPPKIPLKIMPQNSLALNPTAPKSVLRNESMKRSQSADDIFDDPKYTRLSVGSSTSGTQPIPSRNSETYDHLGDNSIRKEGNITKSPPKQPLIKKRSMSTSATGDMAIERRDYKEYMSLQQLLDIMEAKIPSREASEETEDREEQLYCPRVLRPVQF